MPYNVEFDYQALQKDLGFLPGDLAPLLESLFGEKISKAGVYAWFARERMTDDAARKFCQPKGVNSPRSEPRQSGEERPESGQDDIPF